jgi:hypothetical protein
MKPFEHRINPHGHATSCCDVAVWKPRRETRWPLQAALSVSGCSLSWPHPPGPRDRDPTAHANLCLPTTSCPLVTFPCSISFQRARSISLAPSPPEISSLLPSLPPFSLGDVYAHQRQVRGSFSAEVAAAPRQVVRSSPVPSPATCTTRYAHPLAFLSCCAKPSTQTLTCYLYSDLIWLQTLYACLRASIVLQKLSGVRPLVLHMLFASLNASWNDPIFKWPLEQHLDCVCLTMTFVSCFAGWAPQWFLQRFQVCNRLLGWIHLLKKKREKMGKRQSSRWIEVHMSKTRARSCCTRGLWKEHIIYL